MKPINKFPEGWDAERVHRTLRHYESQTEDEALEEDEAALEDARQTLMEIPNELVGPVRALLSQHAK